MTKRRCAAPGCRNRFVPHVSKHGRQRYCSNTCRQRAFYWAFKGEKGVRYAEAREKTALRRRARRKTTPRRPVRGARSRSRR